jgi:predicted nucleic acid-binding protein
VPAAIDDYLLDNNIISIWVRDADVRRPDVVAKLQAIQDKGGKVFLPLVAIAEIRFGLAKCGDVGHPERARLEEFLETYPQHPGFGEHTLEPYVLLRTQLWKTHGTPKKGGRGHKEKLPEQLFDRVTGISLGIDERDLLIASCAAEFNIVLATNDANSGMKHIKAAAIELQRAGQRMPLRIEHWGDDVS